jgi:hypothetical protein
MQEINGQTVQIMVLVAAEKIFGEDISTNEIIHDAPNTIKVRNTCLVVLSETH